MVEKGNHHQSVVPQVSLHRWEKENASLLWCKSLCHWLRVNETQVYSNALYEALTCIAHLLHAPIAGADGKSSP